MARDLNFGLVKKYLLILPLPSCKTVRHESKVTEREPASAVKKSNHSGFILLTLFKLKFGVFSKGRIYDA